MKPCIANLTLKWPPQKKKINKKLKAVKKRKFQKLRRRTIRSPTETQQIYRENTINGDFSEIICRIKPELKINLFLELINIFKNF